ncbi:MAG: cobalamin-dependent protein [Desulfobacterales bacterium]|nr:cobalamin-dependent protein [Desulfobacterales bacterium]
MIKKDQEVKCILIDPPDQISEMGKSQQAPKATEMHEVYPPLGLAYIAGTLMDNGIDVSLIEARTRGLSHDEVIKKIEKEAPQFVGITAITARVNSALYLAQKVKEINPGIKVILGGPHIHFEHKSIIDNDSVDFCVRGEGEITCLDLIDCLLKGGDLTAIRGITFKRGNDIIVNPDRPFVKNLDTFAFPARNLLHNPAYRGLWTEGQTFSPVLSTRGCPYQCAFCAAPRIWGRKHRRRSVENVLDELEQIYKEFGVRYIRFLDDLLIVNKEWTVDLCRGMAERGLDGLTWACDGRVGLVSEKLLKVMEKANCLVIFYGIEFGNQRILDLCKKGFTIKQVRETIDITSRTGISSYGYFMMGYPTETVETIEDTINLAKDLALNHGLDSAGFSIVTPFPGTPLYEYCKMNDMLATSDWSQYSYQLEKGVIKLRNITNEELNNLYERAIDEFQFREKLRQFA